MDIRANSPVWFSYTHLCSLHDQDSALCGIFGLLASRRPAPRSTWCSLHRDELAWRLLALLHLLLATCICGAMGLVPLPHMAYCWLVACESSNCNLSVVSAKECKS